MGKLLLSFERKFVISASSTLLLLLAQLEEVVVVVVGQQVQGNSLFGSQIGFDSVARQGENNTALGRFCTVGGGKKNHAGGNPDLIDPVFADYVVVGGGKNNKASARSSVISGGLQNEIPSSHEYSVIGGGKENGSTTAMNSTCKGNVITGGSNNKWNGKNVGKGFMTISGGRMNVVAGEGAVVTGGLNNKATGIGSVVLGGQYNVASGSHSIVPGGTKNVAEGDHSIAMGSNSLVKHDSSMVINLQGMTKEVESTTEGQFLVQASRYRFQISSDPGHGPDNSNNVILIDETNIKNLRDAIEAQPA